MSRRSGACPQCGATINFKFSSAVQTICEYCRSILVRHDVDLEKVGVAADLPPDVSPIQLGTEGIFGNKAFWVAGRIAYQYDLGGWNEWHIVFNDGESGWLSDAQADYAISFPFAPPAPLPACSELIPGRPFQFDNTRFEVTTLTKAFYSGVEGELPFEYWDKEEVLFADLRSASSRFGTIDYSEEPPLLFLGQAVEFDSLRLKNLKEFEGW
ncbi:MAG: DUF4178 domain-containing protein [Acidimicrobiia bacterium]|nr:DUF4178 domain-containing protein [Acidimicrobiia bacterium]